MCRRRSHFGATLLALWALMFASGMTRSSAVAASKPARIHVVLAAIGGKTVVADVGEDVGLLAHASHLAKGDRILIAEVAAGKITHRVTICGTKVTPCSGIDGGGETGHFTFKAAVVDKHNKVLARSNAVTIVRKKLSLELSFTDPTGKPDVGAELGGVNVTPSVSAPAGTASSWSAIGIVERLSGNGGDWQPVGSLCSLPCDAPIIGVGGTKAIPVDFQAQALDAKGHILLASNVWTIVYQPWIIHFNVNGDAVEGDSVTVARNDQVRIQATVDDPLKIGDQQFDLIILDPSKDPSAQDLADCTDLPCGFKADIPPTNCGACTHTYEAVVQNGRYNIDNTDLGLADLSVAWNHSGYQFDGLTLDFTTGQAICPRVVCTSVKDFDPADWTNSSWHVALSGYVCGDPYSDAWTITIAAIAGGSGSDFTFDPATELGSPQSEYATKIMPQLNHTLEQYIQMYLRGVADPTSGVKTPNDMELNVEIPPSIASEHALPKLYDGLVEWGRVSVESPVQSVAVTTKGDCP